MDTNTKRICLFAAIALLCVGVLMSAVAKVSRADCSGEYNVNKYAPDQCTYYALTKRPDLPWFSGDAGNAKNWAASAEACGFPVGSIPLAGAIAVFSSEEAKNTNGHVAYVEEVYEDGSYEISEKNWGCPPGITGCGPSTRTFSSVDPRTRFVYKKGEPPPYPIGVSPKNDEFFEVGELIKISWQGANSSIEEYKIRLAIEDFRGYDGHGNPTFGSLRSYCETNWFRSDGLFNPVGGDCNLGSPLEGKYQIFITSRWVGTGIEREYPLRYTTFRVGVCQALASLGKLKGGFLSTVHYCPSDIATPTPTPRPTITRVAPTATNTPRPVNTPSATTIPFGIPRLVSPSDGSTFTSGDRIVLSWDCPGGCAESLCLVEREGEIHDSGWTRNLSFISPINNYGDIKWKVRAKKGDGEESGWSTEWTTHINSTGAVPPRLIDPSKGATFNYGNQVILRWECRSYECKADLLKNGVYLGSSGWTQNEAGWRLYSNVGCGSFTWRVKGRNQSQSETGWSPTFDFRIVNCPPTATPKPTGTRTMTGTATRTATATKTGTFSASRTQIPSPTKTKTSVGSRTQTSTPTRTRIVVPTLPPILISTPTPRPTSTRMPTRTPRPTPTPLRLKR